MLQKRAMDVTKLVLPYEPTDILTDLAAVAATDDGLPFEQMHIFPLGGIKTAAEYAAREMAGAKDAATG